MPNLGANLVAMFQAAARRSGDRPFLWAKRDGTYVAWSWRRALEETGLLARCLRALGLERDDRVLLIAENRPEWCVADLAILTAGGVTVPAFTTSTTDDLLHLLEHSGAVGVICSTGSLRQRLLPAVAQAGAVRFIIALSALTETEGITVPVMTWAEAQAKGGEAPSHDLVNEIGWDDLACFIYTSGTGGRPKAVMLTHRNIASNVRGAWALLGRLELGRPPVFLSFLPLSHAYEHSVGQFLPIAVDAEIYYAEGIESLASNLVEARPTVITCVPRLLEVMRQRILVAVERQGGLRARLFATAQELGRRRYREGRLPPHLALVDRGVERLVRRQAQARFGGRLKAMISGGAALNPEVGKFFIALGLPLLQGYGQTEASPTVSVNPPWKNKLETVGPPLEGVRVRIADDGEILVQGDLVMRGYWREPEATAQTLRDGWLHTGDVGRLDADGYLAITDRKKDIIVLSGGDNVAPRRIESLLELEPEIAQALVVGDRRAHLVALLVASPELVRSRAQRHDGAAADSATLLTEPAFREALDAAVVRVNRQLSGTERVRRWHVMPEPFTVENGLMTPTLKLRRPLIMQRHAEIIDALYAGPR